MQKLVSVLIISMGAILLAMSAGRAGIHDYQTRLIEADRFRYGVLEGLIVAQEAAVAAADNQGIQAMPTFHHAHRSHALRRFVITSTTKTTALARALQRKQDLEVELGGHSATAEAELLDDLYALRSKDDLGLAWALGLLVLGWAIIPRNEEKTEKQTALILQDS